MSSISFRSESGEAFLSGAERGHLGNVVDTLGLAFLDPGHNEDLLRHAVPADSPLHRHSDGWAHWFRTYARVDSMTLHAGDLEEDAWRLNLNTAFVVGNDAVRLGARLHAQCEIHAWVDGPNRAWLASIIDNGRKSGLYRPDMGWEAVAELLRSRDDEPVVTSYSVTDGFPAPGRDFEYSEDAYEAWFERPAAEQWADALAWLKAYDGGLEMRPDEWADFRFGNKVDAFQMTDRLRALYAPVAPSYR